VSEQPRTPEATSSPLPEIVGQFASRQDLEGAVKSLRAAGFRHADLSVLDTHESLDAIEKAPWYEHLVGLVGEAKYIGPITTAGFLTVATGPVGAAISAVAGAGVAAMALREALDQVEATPDNEAFARALEQGAVLLWVSCADTAAEERARDILLRHNGRFVHRHQRRTPPEQA